MRATMLLVVFVASPSTAMYSAVSSLRCHAAIQEKSSLRCAATPIGHSRKVTMTARPLLLAAVAASGASNAQSVALAANAASSTLNGIFYISPLRNGVIKTLFGIANQDIFSPVSGALMYLGGLHAAVGLQCIAALMGLRSATETLKLMLGLHAIQCALGLFRAIKTTTAGKLATPTVDAFLGAGGGPATGAAILGIASLVGLLR